MNKDRSSYLGNILKGVQGRIKSRLENPNNKAGLTWLWIKKLKHLPYNTRSRYPFSGSEIEFNNGPELLHSLQEIFVDDIYKIEFSTPTPFILDCGANIGLSVLYHKQRYPGASVVAFEPDVTNFELLQKNIRAFTLQDVELRNEAVWKENTTLEFVSDGTLGSKLNAEGNGKQVIQVKATRLKDLLNRKVDFLKMDIEGAEYEVLKDCAQDLHMVDHLFIEFHGYFTRMNELSEILAIVERNGFSYYIKEASNVYSTPFYRKGLEKQYDIQQNIFCFRIGK